MLEANVVSVRQWKQLKRWSLQELLDSLDVACDPIGEIAIEYVVFPHHEQTNGVEALDADKVASELRSSP
ncbi:MAG: hypothetical protein ABI895_04385 [Deltaproteobacteria bacterium]